MNDVARALSIAALGLLCAAALPSAADITINNGDAPPNPANVIDDATFAAETGYVRNENCPGPPPLGCAAPGHPTTVHFVSGADVDDVVVYETSLAEIFVGASIDDVTVSDDATFTVSGGSVNTIFVPLIGKAIVSGGTVAVSLSAINSGELEITGGALSSFGGALTLSGGTVASTALSANGPATWSGTDFLLSVIAFGADVTFSGGSIAGQLTVGSASVVEWIGGSLGGPLEVRDASLVTVRGRNFEVDGSPVPFGALEATTGVLSGTLANGEPISVTFFQGDEGGALSGTVLLEFAPPIVALGPWGAGALALALLIGTAVRGQRRRE